jgi:LacI family transcriptional regulator
LELSYPVIFYQLRERQDLVKRPTIQDLAKASGVSVATVDRVLNRRLPVRGDTALRVVAAAEAIGFHATGLLRQRLTETPRRTFAYLLQKKDHEFYRNFAAELTRATKEATTIQGRAIVEFMDEIVPSVIAARIREVAPRCDALAVVSVDHPLVKEAIAEAGKPVVTLLSDVTAPERTAYLAADSRRSGRTAGWAISRLAKRPGKIGILLGSHRYLSQELAEGSFRAYMRESAPHFQLLETMVNLDDQRIAYEAIVDMIGSNPDLSGIFCAGGGIEGLVQALRDEKAGDRIVAVGNDLTSVTRSALIDGTLDMVLATPIRGIAVKAVEIMSRACNHENLETGQIVLLPAAMVISESL